MKAVIDAHVKKVTVFNVLGYNMAREYQNEQNVHSFKHTKCNLMISCTFLQNVVTHILDCVVS
jgi:hypothetical protein